MKRIKTLILCVSIVVVILLGITLFEFGLLRLLGLQYESFRALVVFFVIYLFLSAPLSLIIDNVPKALKTVGIIKSSKGWLSFILDSVAAYFLLTTISFFMETIMISWQGILIFSLITGLMGLIIKENDSEPPLIDSKEFQKLEEKIKTNN